jgi:two-component system response regulator MtrA
MGTGEKILLVEDDARLAQQVVATLSEAGFEVTWLARGDQALALAPEAFRLVVLDLMLPGAYGLDVLKHVRARGDVPVLVLSAKSDTSVKVRALELGADDYLVKPFWPEELVARVAARLRRPTACRAERLEAGPLVLDLAARTATLHGEPLDLTRVEFELLAALARRPGAAVQRAWLVEHVLDPDKSGGERTLDVHVSRLRKKLAAWPECIATVWGVGYRLGAGSGA